MRLLYAFVFLVGCIGASERKPKPKEYICECGEGYRYKSNFKAHLKKFKDGLFPSCPCGRHSLETPRATRQADHQRTKGHQQGKSYEGKLSCCYCIGGNFKGRGRYNAVANNPPPTFATKDDQLRHIRTQHLKEVTINDGLGERTIRIPINDTQEYWTNHSFGLLSTHLKRSRKRAQKKPKSSSERKPQNKPKSHKGVKRKRTPVNPLPPSKKRRR